MVASSWILRVAPESKEKVEAWLNTEATKGYVLIPTNEAVQVDFLGIDDAFRFRLQFDEELVA